MPKHFSNIGSAILALPAELQLKIYLYLDLETLVFLQQLVKGIAGLAALHVAQKKYTSLDDAMIVAALDCDDNELAKQVFHESLMKKSVLQNAKFILLECEKKLSSQHNTITPAHQQQITFFAMQLARIDSKNSSTKHRHLFLHSMGYYDAHLAQDVKRLLEHEKNLKKVAKHLHQTRDGLSKENISRLKCLLAISECINKISSPKSSRALLSFIKSHDSEHDRLKEAHKLDSDYLAKWVSVIDTTSLAQEVKNKLKQIYATITSEKKYKM